MRTYILFREIRYILIKNRSKMNFNSVVEELIYELTLYDKKEKYFYR